MKASTVVKVTGAALVVTGLVQGVMSADGVFNAVLVAQHQIRHQQRMESGYEDNIAEYGPIEYDESIADHWLK